MQGKNIFLEQLEFMLDGGKTANDVLGETPAIDLLEEFGVPDKYTGAFFAYYNEYMHGYFYADADILSSVFFNDDDPLEGVREKYLFLYEPIVNLIRAQARGLILRTYIDPSFEDKTGLIVVAQSVIQGLVKPSIIYLEDRLTYQNSLFWSNDSKEVFKQLENIYGTMKDNLFKTTLTMSRTI